MGRLGIEPPNGILLGEEGLERLGPAILPLLLRVDAVQLSALVGPVRERAKVDIRRPGLGQRQDAQLAEEMDPVRRRGDSHQHKVALGEAGELVVREVPRHGERLGLVLCEAREVSQSVSQSPSGWPGWKSNWILDAGEKIQKGGREQ